MLHILTLDVLLFCFPLHAYLVLTKKRYQSISVSTVWQWNAWGPAVGDGSKVMLRFASDTSALSTSWTRSVRVSSETLAAQNMLLVLLLTTKASNGLAHPRRCLVAVMVGVEEHAPTHTPIASRQWEPSIDHPRTKTALGAAVLL